MSIFKPLVFDELSAAANMVISCRRRRYGRTSLREGDDVCLLQWRSYQRVSSVSWLPHEQLQHFISAHGYWAVALIVGLESMGLPLPGETILVLGRSTLQQIPM